MTDYFNVRLPDDEIRAISSIGLAHLGDGVYELLVRAWLCAHGGATGRGMHRSAVRLVCAESQAEKAERIKPLLTEEEKAAKKAELQEILDAAKESGDLKAAADDKEGIMSTTATYGADGSSLAEAVRTAADTLKDGEFAELVEVENGYYAVQMVSAFDSEATENRKVNIVQERRDELYQEKCEELKAAHTFTTVDAVMAKLTFDQTFVVKMDQQGS